MKSVGKSLEINIKHVLKCCVGLLPFSLVGYFLLVFRIQDFLLQLSECHQAMYSDFILIILPLKGSGYLQDMWWKISLFKKKKKKDKIIYGLIFKNSFKSNSWACNSLCHCLHRKCNSVICFLIRILTVL